MKFDVLIIEQPDEYKHRITPQLSRRLKSLANRCSCDNIPVRAVYEDCLEEIFKECNFQYLTGDIKEIVGNNPSPKIVVTGGMLDYQWPKYCLEISDKLNIRKEEIENFREGDYKRKYAFLCGCVPNQAGRIFERLKKQNKNPRIYIDPKTAVSLGIFDLNSLYLFQGIELNGNKIPLYKKVPRNITKDDTEDKTLRSNIALPWTVSTDKAVYNEFNFGFGVKIPFVFYAKKYGVKAIAKDFVKFISYKNKDRYKVFDVSKYEKDFPESEFYLFPKERSLHFVKSANRSDVYWIRETSSHPTPTGEVIITNGCEGIPDPTLKDYALHLINLFGNNHGER